MLDFLPSRVRTMEPNKNTETVNRQRSQAAWISYYPWIVIIFSSLFLFYKYILYVSPSVMTKQLMTFFHVDGLGLGNLGATFLYTSFFVQLLAGPLLDRYRPRMITAIAIGLSALGAVCFSKSQTLFGAELSRSLIGAGAAFATVSYMKFASIWFEARRFAFVGGLLATAAMMGSFFGEAPIALLIKHIGWHETLFYIGVVGFFLAILFFLIVRDRNPYFNHPNPSIPVDLSWKAIFSIAKKKYNWYLMFYSGLAFTPVAVFGGLWGNPFLKEAYHLDNTQAALLTSMMFLGLAIGAPALGFISDQLGKRYEVMLPGLLLTLAALLVVTYANFLPISILGVMLFLFGFGTGAFMLGFTAGRELNSAFLAATVIGLINSGDDLFGAITDPLMGKILDIFSHGKLTSTGISYFSLHDFHIAFIVLPVYLFMALYLLKLLKKNLSQ